MKSEKNIKSINKLIEIVKKLRAPNGCDWDREQTHNSLIPYLIEETYEVIDAIEKNDFNSLKEELGDLLLHVIFQVQLAEESNKFILDDVVESINKKLINRHPHIFIDKSIKSWDSGNWEKAKFTGTELYGKTLGMIGCGNIGSIVAELAIGLKMKVIVFDPYLTSEKMIELGLKKTSLEELFNHSDFITLHTPLNDSTKDIINLENIKKMKKGVRIINCARGGLIVENDLKLAIENGLVAGAAVDVFETEPAKNNCLFGIPEVIATPHLGASTSEAQENVAIQIAEQISEYLVNGSITNAINIPPVSKEEMPKLKPYMNLANKLGKLAGQISSTSITNATISFSGYASKINTNPIIACILEGLLSPRMSTVNMVNAPLIAKERNINISTTFNESAGDYMTEIGLSVNTENRKRTVTGTLFANSPRIVEIMGIKIDAALGKNMLFVTNADQPGFIGSLGSLLGKEKINIGTFSLGRTKQNEDAIALIETDEPVSKEVVSKMHKLPNVQSVKALKF